MTAAYDPLNTAAYDSYCDAQDRAETARREDENDADERAGATLVPCSCSHGCFDCKGTLLIPRRALRWDDGGASERADDAQARLPW